MSNSEALALLEPAATRVRDPVTGRSAWLASLIEDSSIDDDTLRFTLRFTEKHAEFDRSRIREAIVRNVQALGWAGKIECRVAEAQPTRAGAGVHVPDDKPKPLPKPPAGKAPPVRGMQGGGMQPHGGPIEKRPIEGIKHIVAVASGKGGVGKSTVATNLAVSLAKLGCSVGLMDADIYGPSLPMMMKIQGRPLANAEKKIIPLESHGVRCMSMGFLVDDTEPIIWRGPMVMGVVRQFLQDVAWGETDILVIDLPPGTGDAQLTMVQAADLSGAVVVTTPQDVAVLDAVRAIEMFQKLDVPILGLIENMAWLELPDGGKTHPFGSGGGQRTAERYSVPLLGQVPLDGAIREGGDNGVPVALQEGSQGDPFRATAENLKQRLLS